MKSYCSDPSEDETNANEMPSRTTSMPSQVSDAGNSYFEGSENECNGFLPDKTRTSLILEVLGHL